MDASSRNDDGIYLSYKFQDIQLLELALTAPGADEANYEGNRGLACIGSEFLPAFVSVALESIVDRAERNRLLTSLRGRDLRARIARQWKLDQYLKASRRRGGDSDSVVGAALCAVYGAACLESGYSQSAVAPLTNVIM